jgi:hypothetical protein
MERLFMVNWGTSEKGARSVIFSIDWNRKTRYEKKTVGWDLMLDSEKQPSSGSTIVPWCGGK